MRPRRYRDEKPLHWIGSSKKDLLGFPEQVVDDIGFALGDVRLVTERLKAAKQDYEERYGKETD
jgi:phage-related protein